MMDTDLISPDVLMVPEVTMADTVNIVLSRETAALAERLAAAKGVSVEEAITQAIAQSARADVESRDSARTALLERLRAEPVVDAGPWRRDDLYEDTP